MVWRALTRPRRLVARVRALKDTILGHLRHSVDLQQEVKAEVRELHHSSLLAAIQVIEEQRRTRAEMAEDYARLERRLGELERRLAAPGASEDPEHRAGAEPSRPA